MTRLQENAIERLALRHGRVAVRETSREVRVEVPSGVRFRLRRDGVLRPSGRGRGWEER